MKRPPTRKPKTIRVGWGETKHDSADLFVSWGEGTHCCDARFALSKLSDLAEEMKKRGYSVPSLRFEITKQKPDASREADAG